MRKPIWLLVATILFLPPLAGSIDEREFACEEALQHVLDCCPDAGSFTCGATCEPTQTDLATSDCLRKATCDELRESGACRAPLQAVCK